MLNFKKTAAALSIALVTSASAAMADDTSTVQVFYDFLSNPGSATHADAFRAATTSDWGSIGDYSGQVKSSEAFIGQLGGFANLIPDLNWAVEAMHQDGDTVIVRSRATGTPVAPFFGVDGEGRSFEIMAIDIHELSDGVIARTYHVEDWSTALRQLSGQ